MTCHNTFVEYEMSSLQLLHSAIHSSCRGMSLDSVAPTRFVTVGTDLAIPPSAGSSGGETRREPGKPGTHGRCRTTPREVPCGFGKRGSSRERLGLVGTTGRSRRRAFPSAFEGIARRVVVRRVDNPMFEESVRYPRLGRGPSGGACGAQGRSSPPIRSDQRGRPLGHVTAPLSACYAGGQGRFSRAVSVSRRGVDGPGFQG